MKAHLLFEQFGTFKNEFKKLGIDAEDYDIQDEFGETDHQVDLFSEIETAYEGGQVYSITSPKKTSSWRSFLAQGLRRKCRFFFVARPISK